jgi:two-component system, chemotaxis family, chemotaxis protein CheY
LSNLGYKTLKKILVVEDDSVSRKIICRFLEKYGTVHIAVNGKEALKLFKKALDEKTPYNLICLDIMMPAMNGHETLEFIRRAEEKSLITGHSRTTIIMTTALDSSEHILQSFNNQCDGYITKPVTRKKIENEFSKLNLLLS